MSSKALENVVKLNSIRNIKQYGAIGNGLTDDLQAIQSAVDAAFDAGGGIVFVPQGTYAISDAIKLKSHVHLKGEGFASRIISSASGAILADRDDAIDEATPYSNIVVSDLYVQAEWGGPTPARITSTILLEFCNDSLVENVFVNKGSDACIRISGYRKGITSFTPSFTNPDFGFAKRNMVRNCTVQEGYLGIELVGGAQCDIVNNTIVTCYQHGIRLAAGGWFCSVSGNKVMTCLHSAWYGQLCQNVVVSSNYLKSERPGTPTGVSIGTEYRNMVFDGNTIVGVVTDRILPDGVLKDTIVVSNNVIEGNCEFEYAQDLTVVGNTISGSLRLQGNAKAQGQNNIIGNLIVDASTDLVQNGGNVYYGNNLLAATLLPASPTVQASVLGTAAAIPSTGTFRQGDIILKAAATDFVGWICTSAGTPGTWQKFGELISVYTRRITGRQDGLNLTQKLLSFSVPNGTHTIRLSIALLLSRAPASSPAQSRVIQKEITIVRNTGSGCVIDDALATGNYEQLTTTAGGTNTPSASSLTATITAGGATATQVIDVTAFFGPVLIYGTYTIDVQSTSELSVFGL
jgi:parallel beta-helix repeat protein